MTFNQFCSKFYNDGKSSYLHARRSKPAIARFFLESALDELNIDSIPKDGIKKWFAASQPSSPKMSLWEHVCADREANEIRLTNVLYSVLPRDKELLLI